MTGLRMSLQNVLHRVGIDIRRYPPQDDVFRQQIMSARRIQMLRAQQITLVLDVGANSGQYAQALRGSGYRGRLVSFEPLPEAFALLRAQAAPDAGWECRPLALGSHDGEATLHVSASSACSSLLPILDTHRTLFPGTDTIGSVTVAVAKLDSVPDLIRPGERACLKIDVQGLELDVLRGAARTLTSGQIPLIELEICLIPLYEGQPRPHSLLAFLDDAGYDCAALEQGGADPATGHMLWVDGLFVRRPEARP